MEIAFLLTLCPAELRGMLLWGMPYKFSLVFFFRILLIIPLTPFQGGVTSPDPQKLKFELTIFDFERKFKSVRNA
jgi:hypothetical protein